METGGWTWGREKRKGRGRDLGGEETAVGMQYMRVQIKKRKEMGFSEGGMNLAVFLEWSLIYKATHHLLNPLLCFLRVSLNYLRH